MSGLVVSRVDQSAGLLLATSAVGLAGISFGLADAAVRPPQEPSILGALELELGRSRRHGNQFVLIRFPADPLAQELSASLPTRETDRWFWQRHAAYVLLSDTDRAGAQQWLQRAAASAERGSTLDAGLAVFPDDGYTVGALLDRAHDRSRPPLRGVPQRTDAEAAAVAKEQSAG